MKISRIYQYYCYPTAIISHYVWLYYRFILSSRDIELIMMQKRIFSMPLKVGQNRANKGGFKVGSKK